MSIDLSITAGNEREDFSRIANDLMNNWILQVGEEEYRIAEIEFYYQSEMHKDSYAHAHVLQKESGNWYFHGSGLDITFGKNGNFGGILIRAFYNVKTKQYQYGPLNVVTEIFKNFNGIEQRDIHFGFKHCSTTPIKYEKPIAAPRVGLNPTKNPDMYKQLYRYLIMPKEKHVAKQQIYDSMLEQKYSKQEADDIWG